jgi:hypothetical protein
LLPTTFERPEIPVIHRTNHNMNIISETLEVYLHIEGRVVYDPAFEHIDSLNYVLFFPLGAFFLAFLLLFWFFLPLSCGTATVVISVELFMDESEHSTVIV